MSRAHFRFHDNTFPAVNKSENLAEKASFKTQDKMELLTANKRKFTGPVPKTRSIPGPTPHAVQIVSCTYRLCSLSVWAAILHHLSLQMERPRLNRPPEWRILERRRKEDKIDNAIARVDYNQKNDLKVSRLRPFIFCTPRRRSLKGVP